MIFKEAGGKGPIDRIKLKSAILRNTNKLIDLEKEQLNT